MGPAEEQDIWRSSSAEAPYWSRRNPQGTRKRFAEGPHRTRYNNPKRQILFIFWILFRSMEKMAWGGPKRGREVLFPANPDLATFWATWIWILKSFIFLKSFVGF